MSPIAGSVICRPDLSQTTGAGKITKGRVPGRFDPRGLDRGLIGAGGHIARRGEVDTPVLPDRRTSVPRSNPLPSATTDSYTAYAREPQSTGRRRAVERARYVQVGTYSGHPHARNLWRGTWSREAAKECRYGAAVNRSQFLHSTDDQRGLSVGRTQLARYELLLPSSLRMPRF